MIEKINRSIFGLVYVIILWTCTSYSLLTFQILFALIAIISIYEIYRLRKNKSKFIAITFVLIPFIIIQMFNLKDNPNEIYNPSIILFMFALVWSFDSFAYLFGVNFGENKIMPSISPKKSWEGFFGGFICTVITAQIITNYLNIVEINIILISILVPFTATLGDFIISYYKRIAKVKDSGKIIPGHGGILDRMDAFIITIPVFYILINLL
jgi:phosphatidate cytidylyltransferase